MREEIFYSFARRKTARLIAMRRRNFNLIEHNVHTPPTPIFSSVLLKKIPLYYLISYIIANKNKKCKYLKRKNINIFL
jgi:hypothetical protein